MPHKIKIKKFTQRKCKINFDMGTGKVILWHFVGQMKGAQEYSKVGNLQVDSGGQMDG